MWKDYILTVDRGRPWKGNTAGRYRACARSEKEAIALTQKAIGFGKVRILTESNLRLLSPKEVRREIRKNGRYLVLGSRHANEPLEKEEDSNGL